MPGRPNRSQSVPRFAALAALCGAAAFAHAAPTATPAVPAATSRLDSLVLAESRIQWAASPPETALARAARQGRPAFLDFYATWCAPCRWMDRAVYNDPLLGEAAEDVVMVRVDVDRPEGKAIASRFGILQYPTLVYLGPEGKETLRWVGPLNLRDTRLNLAQAAMPSSRRAEVVKGLEEKPDDGSRVLMAVGFYGYRGEVERARTIADGWLKGAGAGRPKNERAAVALQLAKAEEFAGRDDRAAPAYQRVLALEPDGGYAWRAYLGLSACRDRAGDRVDAKSLTGEAMRRGPHFPFLDARFARLSIDAPPPATPPGVDDGRGGSN